jgi:hypothetical protein
VAKAPSSAMQSDAESLERSIHECGDFGHVKVRINQRHLEICSEGEAVARATAIGGGTYGLSFRTHAGKWEPMPFSGTTEQLGRDVTTALGPYLEKWNFPRGNSGSDH